MKLILTMAFVLACEITVGNYRFRQVNNVRIEKSWRELGDKCTIRLPALKRRLQEIFKAGDAVTVNLWYDGQTQHTEFVGYVRRVMPNIPFGLECEDQVHLLRKTNLNKSWKDTTLKEIINYLVNEVNTKFSSSITISGLLPTVNFKQFRYDNVNAAQALQKLKEEFGLTAYFRGKELFVGLAYQQKPGTVKYSLAWNVIGYDLEERREEDFQLKVKAIGIKRDNTRIEVEVGDKDGEQKTFHSYTIHDKEQLKKYAEEEMKKLKFTGFDGSIQTFLYPYAEPLMTAKLSDPQYGERRSGSYVVDSVVTEFGTQGARREVELGVKLSV
jgi:hypothetical protein